MKGVVERMLTLRLSHVMPNARRDIAVKRVPKDELATGTILHMTIPDTACAGDLEVTACVHGSGRMLRWHCAMENLLYDQRHSGALNRSTTMWGNGLPPLSLWGHATLVACGGGGATAGNEHRVAGASHGMRHAMHQIHRDAGRASGPTTQSECSMESGLGGRIEVRIDQEGLDALASLLADEPV